MPQPNGHSSHSRSTFAPTRPLRFYTACKRMFTLLAVLKELAQTNILCLVTVCCHRCSQSIFPLFGPSHNMTTVPRQMRLSTSAPQKKKQVKKQAPRYHKIEPPKSATRSKPTITFYGYRWQRWQQLFHLYITPSSPPQKNWDHLSKVPIFYKRH